MKMCHFFLKGKDFTRRDFTKTGNICREKGEPFGMAVGPGGLIEAERSHAGDEKNRSPKYKQIFERRVDLIF